MVLKKRIYKIKLYTKHNGNEYEITDVPYDINDFIESVEPDTYNPVDLYDFTGEPRKCKIELRFKNFDQYSCYKSIFKQENEFFDLLDNTPIVASGDIFLMEPFVNIQPNTANEIVFPGWYNQDTNDYTVYQPPVIDVSEEPTGEYLDYDDIYVKKKSKFRNIYVKVYSVEDGSLLLNHEDLEIIGMIETETLHFSKPKMQISFTIQDGLAALYDSLEKYSNFCTFCQDENATGLPIKNSGVTMKDFLFSVLPNLTQYPYSTLYDFELPLVRGRDEELYDYQFDYSANIYNIISALNYTGHWGYSNYDSSILIYDSSEECLYLISRHLINIDTGIPDPYIPGINIYEYFHATLARKIEISIEDDVLIPGDVIDSGYTYRLSSYHSYADAILDIFSVSLNISDIIENVNAAVQIENIGPTEFGVWLSEVTNNSCTLNLQIVSGNELSELFELCTSFNTSVSPLDVVRLICLTTGSFLVCEGYDIRLVNLEALTTNAYTKIINYDYTVKGSYFKKVNLESDYDFTEIESVTLWRDTDAGSNDGKALKAKLKSKLHILLNTSDRYEMKLPKTDHNLALKWGDIIAIINSPEASNKQYFIYGIDSKGTSIKIEIFSIGD